VANDSHSATDPAADMRLPVGGLILCAVAAALLGGLAGSRLVCVSRDGAHYIRFAQQLSEDPGYYLRAHRSQPGYSAAILVTHGAVGRLLAEDSPDQWIRCGQIVSIASLAACVPLIALLTARLFGASAAIIAAMLAVTWPQALQLAGDVLSDLPHLALYLAAMLLGGSAIQRGSLMRLAWAGVTAAAAYLVRQEALALPIALGGLWVLTSVRTSRGAGRAILGAVILVAAFLAPLLPYAMVTGRVLHKKTVWELFFGAGTPTALIAPAAMSEPSPVRADLTSRVQLGGSMLEGWAKSGRYLFSTLATIALVASRGRGPAGIWPRLILLLLLLHCAAVGLRGLSFGAVSTRYMLIPAALTLPWAAAGACAVSVALRNMIFRQSSTTVAAVLCVVAMSPMLLWYGLRPINANDAFLHEAGAWLHRTATPTDVLLAENRLCQAACYSGLAWNEWPDRDWSAGTIRRRAAETDARWFVELIPAASGRMPASARDSEPATAPDSAVVAAWPGRVSAFEQTNDQGDRVRIFRKPDSD